MIGDSWRLLTLSDGGEPASSYPLVKQLIQVARGLLKETGEVPPALWEAIDQAQALLSRELVR